MDDEVKRPTIRAMLPGVDNVPPGPAAIARKLGIAEAEAAALADELVAEGLFKVIYDSSPEGTPGPLYEQTPRLWTEMDRLGI